MSQFQAGDDSRRNRAGRPPSSRSIAAHIRATLGRDTPAIIERLRVLAQAGDPTAVAAVATLIAATIGPTK